MCITAVDPYGNRVHIPEAIILKLEFSKRDGETVDSPEQVIKRPAIMLTTCTGPMESPVEHCENHYLRLINWEDTVLISARKQDGKWTVYRCLCNPSTTDLASLFRTARQLL